MKNYSRDVLQRIWKKCMLFQFTVAISYNAILLSFHQSLGFTIKKKVWSKDIDIFFLTLTEKGNHQSNARCTRLFGKPDQCTEVNLFKSETW